MSKSSLETTPTAFTLGKVKIKSKVSLKRIEELSRPKIRLETYDEVVGPGTYQPKESYLSTKSKSPSVAIGRSERFLRDRIGSIKNQIREYQESDLSKINYYLSDVANSPKYSFKRTGHNLVLAHNPEFPGAGKYSIPIPNSNSSYIFSKASKNFNWKKGNT